MRILSGIKKVFVIAVIVLIASSCSKEDFGTGFTGTIEFGEGSCIPGIPESARKYENYNGRVYFVEKSAADSLGEPGFVRLKLKSTSVEAQNGKVSVELPAGTFVIMTDEYFVNDPEFTITVTEGQILRKDFKIWVCTSF